MSEPMLGKKILVVDDDYYFRLVLEKTLKHHGFQPTCAENAKHAQRMLTNDKFDVVISDIRMPFMNGLELLQWIKMNCPTPVILMTGFTALLETQDAAEHGAEGFLAKPFKTEEMLDAIASCLGQKQKPGTEKHDTDFSKIYIDDFLAGREMKFDIYIRVQENKFVKIAQGGEDLPMNLIQSCKSRNIRFLHVKKTDFKKFIGFNIPLLADDANTTKGRDLQRAAEATLRTLYVEQINREEFEQAVALVENTVSLLCDHPSSTKLLIRLNEQADFLLPHCLAVSLYASLIGKALDWRSPTTIYKLAMGGLLHDVGKVEVPKFALVKSRMSQIFEEVASMETHAACGVELMAQLEFIPTDVMQIVHQHHEDCLGLGYPARLTRSKIHPLSRVVAVANELCNLVVKNPNSAGMSPGVAVQQMLSLNPKRYDEDALNALIKVLNISH